MSWQAEGTPDSEKSNIFSSIHNLADFDHLSALFITKKKTGLGFNGFWSREICDIENTTESMRP